MDIDPQEVTNAWRLDRRGDEEDWSETVYPLSSSSGEDEPVSPEPRREDEIDSTDILIWAVRFAAIGYFGIVFYRLWSDDEIRLHLLHFSARMLQSTAHTIGRWGLHAENLYGEFVDSLH